MSNEAIVRLTEYLNQTRRQAEQSIDHLNNQLQEKQTELDNHQEVVDHVIGERDYYRNLSEQLKLENSKKWRLNERDDWKSLVESIQADRARLNEEVSRLEAELLNIQVNARLGNASSGEENLAENAEGAGAGAGAGEGKAVVSERVARLERELRAANKRIIQLEHSLHNKASTDAYGLTAGTPGSANGVRAEFMNRARDRDRSDSVGSTFSNASTSASTISAASMNGTGRSRAATRVITQQRKIAADHRSTALWPLSVLFGPKSSPHEEKTSTGVLFV